MPSTPGQAVRPTKDKYTLPLAAAAGSHNPHPAVRTRRAGRSPARSRLRTADTLLLLLLRSVARRDTGFAARVHRSCPAARPLGGRSRRRRSCCRDERGTASPSRRVGIGRAVADRHRRRSWEWRRRGIARWRSEGRRRMGCAGRSFAAADTAVGAAGSPAGLGCRARIAAAVRIVVAGSCSQGIHPVAGGKMAGFDCDAAAAAAGGCHLRLRTGSTAAARMVGMLLEELDPSSRPHRLSYDLRSCSRNRCSAAAGGMLAAGQANWAL